MKNWLRFCFTGLLIAGTANAEPNKAWTFSQADESSHAQTLKSSSLAVSLSPSFLLTLQIGETVSLPISSNKSYTVLVSKIQNKGSVRVIFGTIEHNAISFPVNITVGERGIYARVVTPEGNYYLESLDGSGFLKPRSTYMDKLDLSEPDFLIPPKFESAEDAHSSGLTFETTQVQVELAAMTVQPRTIRWLVAYTDQALLTYPDMSTRLAHIEATTNQIYQDSGVQLTIELAHAFQSDISEAISSNAMLTGLDNRTLNGWQEIATQRVNHRADFVTVMRISPPGSCGLGWINGDENKKFDYQYAYNIVSIDCPDDTAAHELGHNMGLGHSLIQGDEGSVFSFGRGHGVNNSFSTVMAYQSFFGSADSVFVFSNPDISTCNGLACGVDEELSNGANAVLAINSVLDEISLLHDEENPPILIDTALSELTDSNLVSCINSSLPNAFSTYDVSNLDCEQQDITSLQGIANFKQLSRLILNNNDISDYTALAQLTNLQTLSLQFMSQLNDISFVAGLTNLDWFGVNSNTIPCWQKNVMENRGLSTAFFGGSTCAAVDNDNDDDDNNGVINVDDPDDDGNGVDDLAELLVVAVVDTDSDGINDDEDNCPNIPNAGQWNKDGDDFGNECDDDIDGDGVLNDIEIAAGTSAWDASSFPVDADDDGIDDSLDNCLGLANQGQWDRDGDGVGNECDLDVDGDGAPNLIELARGTNSWDPSSTPQDGDEDGDGINDFLDNCYLVSNDGQWDNDNDGLGNHCDADVDGDGHLNIVEKAAGTGVWDPNSFPQGNDFDGDEIVDNEDNCPLISNVGQWDRDKDNIGNECDDDLDGDGFANRLESLAGTNAWDPNSFPEISGVDTDNDGIDDAIDNCDEAVNVEQWDKDNDGIGNVCDSDIDGDGFSNEEEIAAGSGVWNAASTPES